MVLEGISYDEALPYLDDTCIHSKDLDGHYLAMKKMFDEYRRAGLKIQTSKCHLFQAENRVFRPFYMERWRVSGTEICPSSPEVAFAHQ
jgi:hypothetical protein